MTDVSRASLETLVERTWDAIVVGGGPAGAVAANMLSRRFSSVLLIDKAAFPREKVCGDGIIADATNCLRRLDLLDLVDKHAHRVSDSSVFSPSRIQLDLPGDYRTLKRIIFDDLLVRSAVERGAALLQSQVEAVQSDDVRGLVSVRVKGAPTPIMGRVALVATGADVSLLRPLGIVSRASPSAVAVRAYVRSSFLLDRMVVSYDRSIVPGYAWIFPMGGGEFNVGCGIFYRTASRPSWNPRAMLNRFTTEFPLASELMRHGEFVTPLRGAPLRCGLQGTHTQHRGRILAIGETLGATFPFTGEGIGKAMETAEIAAEVVTDALVADDMRVLDRFPDAIRSRLLPRYRGYHIAEQWLSVPWLNDFVARRAQRSQSLQRAMQGIINETVDPREVFSLRGILASFWR